MLLGIKAQGHDGSFAVIDGDTLILAVEAEKVDNRERYATYPGLDWTAHQLRQHRIDPADIDTIVYDGWWNGPATYDYTDTTTHRLAHTLFDGRPVPTYAYPHAIGHVYGTYMTRPPQWHGPTHVLVWDGGMYANLYLVDGPHIERKTTILPVTGSIYPIVASHCEPYRQAWKAVEPHMRGTLPYGEPNWSHYNLTIPGKAMAYAAHDDPDPHIVDAWTDALNNATNIDSPVDAYNLVNQVAGQFTNLGNGAAWMSSFQHAIATIITERLAHITGPLCMSGGSFLNIKWNNAIRTQHPDTWIPPFPNDSGGAIGAAAAHLAHTAPHLNWNVYSGPRLQPPNVPDGWTTIGTLTPKQLGEHIAHTGQPHIVLHGNAELGPRALGHRSILAPATNPDMQATLNHIKRRESYRPVAPIALADHAPTYFNPGTPDPYMLYDHQVRPEHLNTIPAIRHIDNSARLQTIDATQCPTTTAILGGYAHATNIPVLCNTSANGPGIGFFPDAASAMQWGRTDYVWADGTLYASTIK